MSETQNLTYQKLTNFKLFKWKIFSKEEIYNERSCEGIPYQIIITQDYYNKEFKNVDKN